MPGKLAIKRLTQSDLSFFDYHYHNNPSIKQKAINLNAKVFVDEIYPGLTSSKDKFPVSLTLLGPGKDEPYFLQRKVVRSNESKNWRLNGEIVINLEDNPSRFNILQINDVAVFAFDERLAPQSISVAFVAANLDTDKELHTLLSSHVSNTNVSMVSILPSDLNTEISKIQLLDNHSIYYILSESGILSPDEETIVLGGAPVTVLTKATKLKKFQGIRSRENLQEMRRVVEEVGFQGEQFVNTYLLQLQEKGDIQSFRWISQENAISAFDFEIYEANGTKILVDVKSTQNDFSRSIHVSLNELIYMREVIEKAERYDIYRIFDMSESKAQLRIARSMRDFASQILTTVQKFPGGVALDSISINPNTLNFEDAIDLKAPIPVEET